MIKLVNYFHMYASIWENFLPKISGGDQKSICGTLYTFIHKTDTLVLDLSYVLQVSSLHCVTVLPYLVEKPMWREIHFAFWLPFLNLHFINFVVVTNDRKSNICRSEFFLSFFLARIFFDCLIWFGSNLYILSIGFGMNFGLN